VLTNDAPEQSAGGALAPWDQGRRRRRLVAAALAVVLAAYCATTARLFMFPARGMPAHADAIVMLGGRGDRYGEAVKLAQQHRAPYLVISLGSSLFGQGPPGDLGSGCAPPIPQVRVICFAPDPATTPGGGRVCWPPGGEAPLALPCPGDHHASGLARPAEVQALLQR
jgi:hypothetical protein